MVCLISMTVDLDYTPILTLFAYLLELNILTSSSINFVENVFIIFVSIVSILSELYSLMIKISIPFFILVTV